MKNKVIYVPCNIMDGYDAGVSDFTIEKSMSAIPTTSVMTAKRMVDVNVLTDDELKEIITNAHMAGQNGFGIDPSYGEALSYYLQNITS